ncbi:hypothetical protein TNCV_3045901 [Trichonephila clavipes]|uniref:Uncharacterized protein n=1 Tax=Trichonephila clavipes TaxID=2585209 RepID=A0A8X6RH80_TRICX|nr:hypothetical protein TNCV_3045901 [Trichonephila clavipes]
MVVSDAKMIAKVAKLAANLVSKNMPTWLYRQDFAKFSLNRHYNIELRLEIRDVTDDGNAANKTYESRILEGVSSSDESDRETHGNI